MGIGPGAVGSGSLHQCGHRNSIVDLECVEAQESVSLVSGSGGNRRPPPPPSRLFDVCFARLHSFYLILLLSIAPGNMFFLYDENKRQNCVVYLFTLFVCLGREGFVLRSGFRTFGAMRFAKNLMFGYSIFCLSALYRPCCVGASMIARDPIPKTREKRK